MSSVEDVRTGEFKALRNVFYYYYNYYYYYYFNLYRETLPQLRVCICNKEKEYLEESYFKDWKMFFFSNIFAFTYLLEKHNPLEIRFAKACEEQCCFYLECSRILKQQTQSSVKPCFLSKTGFSAFDFLWVDVCKLKLWRKMRHSYFSILRLWNSEPCKSVQHVSF